MGPHCRISRVRMKDGGADVRVLKSGGGLSTRAKLLLEYARQTAAIRDKDGDFAGFLILAWGSNGWFTVSGDVATKESRIPINLLPAWVEETVRREFVTGREVRQIIDNEYVTPNSKPPRGA